MHRSNEAYLAAGLAALTSIAGFTPLQVLNYVYGNGEAQTDALIDEARKGNPELERVVQDLIAEKSTDPPHRSSERDRLLDEIVLTSRDGRPALEALLKDDSPAWYVRAVLLMIQTVERR